MANNAVIDALLTDIKISLNVTWDDEVTDANLRDLIQDGIAYLDDKAGDSCDYLVSGYPRTLLKEYVRYARDAALDVFENNYRSLILAMQNNKGVSRFVESSEQTE